MVRILELGRAGINCEKDFIWHFFDDLKMDRNELFKFLKGCRSFVIEVVQFFEKPVKSGHQDGGEQVFFVLEMIIKEGFGRTCLLDNLNGGGSFIALFGKQAARNLNYFLLFFNISFSRLINGFIEYTDRIRTQVPDR